MTTESTRLQVSSTIGQVSAESLVPDKSIGILTLAHGAGAGMNHVFMESLAKALGDEGIATVRFNFPFAENKKGRPDLPAVAHKTVEAVIQHTQSTYPDLPLFVSGKSFGGRMTSQYLSGKNVVGVNGIIFYGFPLHPPGKPATDRADHLKEVNVPMLFLQGTRDELAKWDLIESVTSSLPAATLIKIEGADHAFKAGKQNIIALLAKATKEWIQNFHLI
ncbi:MAG TPA: alpha/beta family hydrolase [Flavitalea sp.]|nr:alpha/beta family hydrolase [Flavitalea sp.]